MDTNVMHTYKSVAEMPKHHVQYDQVGFELNKKRKTRKGSCKFLIEMANGFYFHFLSSHLQGEDRWLCTLMLKQGWRVEYSAASDSFTKCPEVTS